MYGELPAATVLDRPTDGTRGAPARPLVGISFDLDDRWSYMKTHGQAGWEKLPSYLDVVVPRVLELFERRGLKLTFFVVGLDVAQERNAHLFRAIADAGHEIGNHSYHHEPWLHRYTDEQLEFEIGETEALIRRVTGSQCTGFRGPGYSSSPALLQILVRRGYTYDASTFPTFIGPLARAYYLLGSRMTKEERATRGQLFGRFREGFLPLKPHWLSPLGARILEIPVTTMPIARLPIHPSYLLYFSGYSRRLAHLYLGTALRLCRLTATRPSLLFHPLDFLGREDRIGLDFFPAARLPVGPKLQFVEEVIDRLAAAYDLAPMRTYAEAIAAAEPFP